MSYNLKCCSFYPNNFDASALFHIFKVIVPRPRYACTSVGGHMYLGRGTHVPRSGYDDIKALMRRQQPSCELNIKNSKKGVFLTKRALCYKFIIFSNSYCIVFIKREI